MAVAVDAAGTAFTAAATTTFTQGASTITVGAGANRVLALLIQFGGVVSGVTAFWDEAATNQAMTLVGSDVATDNLGSTYIFGLIAPTSGAKLLKVSWTGSASYAGDMISFTGADQGSVAGTFKNFTSGHPSASATATGLPYPPGGTTVNSPANDFCVICAGSGNQGFATVTGGQTGTFLYGINTNVSGAGVYTTGAGAATAISIETAGNGNVATPACYAACDIAAVGTAAAVESPPPSRIFRVLPRGRQWGMAA